MDTVTRAMTKGEIAFAEARLAKAAAQLEAKQVLPEGFQASRIIPLAVPIEYEGITYSEVHIRRLKGKDFFRLQEMTGNEDVSLLAIVTAVPTPVIEELDAEDFVRLSEAAQDFLPRSLRQAAAPISDNGQGSQQ